MSTPTLIAHALAPEVLPLVPAAAERDWMEQGDRRAYRCLPLSIANASGWEYRCPIGFRAFWNGGPALADIRFEIFEGRQPTHNFIASHFGLGVITFAIGHLFRTDPGWGLWVRGAPNHVKDGIQALDAVVETDWLPFTFTMNWKFTRPGIIEFKVGEPFCFVMPFQHTALDAIEPKVVALKENPDLEREYLAWMRSRRAFNEGLARRSEGRAKQSWKKLYHQVKTATGGDAPHSHVSRRKLKSPLTQDHPQACGAPASPL